jgi:hypothetical protein
MLTSLSASHRLHRNWTLSTIAPTRRRNSWGT